MQWFDLAGSIPFSNRLGWRNFLPYPDNEEIVLLD